MFRWNRGRIINRQRPGLKGRLQLIAIPVVQRGQGQLW
jgi:hypothetical protein